MKRFALTACLAGLLFSVPFEAAAHEYDRDDSDYPLRYVGYVLHAPALLVEYVIFRPVHKLVSTPTGSKIFGHEVTEDGHAADGVFETVYDTSRKQEVPLVEPTPAPAGPPAEASAQPLPKPPDAPAERRIAVQSMPEANTIYFDYNRSSLRDDQLQRLEENLALLRDHPELQVQIVGHTDERGSTEYNYNLGVRRAQSVQEHLTKNGIAADRISILSRGEESPADPGGGEEAWAKNRRAEFMKLVVIEAGPAAAAPSTDGQKVAQAAPGMFVRQD
jgi:peptidoglycan-associated lipoprotein